jgi:hypothetical protein
MRQFSERDWTVASVMASHASAGDGYLFAPGKSAAISPSSRTPRHENRLRERIAIGNGVRHSLARFEVVGCEPVEALCACPFAYREITQTVGIECEPLVEARKVAREVVDLLALEVVAGCWRG